MSVDSLELQLAAAVQRFNMLQRRGDAESGKGSTLLARALDEIEKALEELRVAQEQLVENRSRLDQMQSELTAQYEKYWELFNEMPQPYVVTKPDTTISEANEAAAELFNVSQRFLCGKTLSIFVCENRTGFLQAVERAAAAPDVTEMTVRIRPRERGAIDVAAKVRGGKSLRWVLRRV
jgi:PAS domain S-box-containing protein